MAGISYVHYSILTIKIQKGAKSIIYPDLSMHGVNVISAGYHKMGSRLGTARRTHRVDA